MDPDAFAPLPEGPGEAAAASAAGHTLYRCRKCRQLLATSQHVVPVEAAMGGWEGGSVVGVKEESTAGRVHGTWAAACGSDTAYGVPVVASGRRAKSNPGVCSNPTCDRLSLLLIGYGAWGMYSTAF